MGKRQLLVSSEHSKFVVLKLLITQIFSLPFRFLAAPKTDDDASQCKLTILFVRIFNYKQAGNIQLKI